MTRFLPRWALASGVQIKRWLEREMSPCSIANMYWLSFRITRRWSLRWGETVAGRTIWRHPLKLTAVRGERRDMEYAQALRIWTRILGGRRPILSIEITRECPLRCPGCYAYEDGHLGGGITLRQLVDRRGDELIEGALALVERYRPVHLPSAASFAESSWIHPPSSRKPVLIFGSSRKTGSVRSLRYRDSPRITTMLSSRCRA